MTVHSFELSPQEIDTMRKEKALLRIQERLDPPSKSPYSAKEFVIILTAGFTFTLLVIIGVVGVTLHNLDMLDNTPPKCIATEEVKTVHTTQGTIVEQVYNCTGVK